MLKKTITFTDYNGTEQTKDFYFNLSKAEIARMEIVEQGKGGLQKMLQAIVDSGDGHAIMDKFEEIIRTSYGVRSNDGTSFVKTKEATDLFLGSPAYDILFLELVTDAVRASAFINGIVPAEFADGSVSGRPSPQDYKPSAREQFAQKAGTVEQSQPVWPSDANRVQDAQPVQPTPPIPAEPMPAPSPENDPPSRAQFRNQENRDHKDREEFEEWKRSRMAEKGQPEEDSGGAISRPPHESGPGYYQE